MQHFSASVPVLYIVCIVYASGVCCVVVSIDRFADSIHHSALPILRSFIQISAIRFIVAGCYVFELVFGFVIFIPSSYFHGFGYTGYFKQQ